MYFILVSGPGSGTCQVLLGESLGLGLWIMEGLHIVVRCVPFVFTCRNGTVWNAPLTSMSVSMLDAILALHGSYLRMFVVESVDVKGGKGNEITQCQ